MKYYCCLLLFSLLTIQCRQKEENTPTQFTGKPEVPSSIKKEHEDLLTMINALASFDDSAGRAAAKLGDLLRHHFTEEEDFVFLQLGLLPMLASEKLPDQKEKIIMLSYKLRSQLTHMSVEHQLIKAYVGELKEAPGKKDTSQVMELAKKIQQHAKTEEEIFFPAAILVGEYLKLKS